MEKQRLFSNQSVAIAAILLIALNLRGPFTGVAPLLDMISSGYELTSSQAGLLTTLPLLMFALFSPMASWFSHRWGLERALISGLGIIVAGVLVRSIHHISMLYTGTALIGIGIAIANVLLPSLLKRDFSARASSLTAVYVLSMSLGGALCSSVAIPIANLAEQMNITVLPGWNISLLSSVFMVLVPLVLWLPCWRFGAEKTASRHGLERKTQIWRSPIAWQVSFFFAFNSLLNYVFISWFPAFLVESGFKESEAGVYHGILQLAGALPSILMVPLLAKVKDKRILSLSMTLLTLCSIVGLISLPELALVWTILMGIGVAGAFIMGLALLTLRTHDARQAAALSGMAQCFGYLFAAMGPITIGAIRDISGSWRTPMLVMAGCCVIWSVVGLLASRSGVIGQQEGATEAA